MVSGYTLVAVLAGLASTAASLTFTIATLPEREESPLSPYGYAVATIESKMTVPGVPGKVISEMPLEIPEGRNQGEDGQWYLFDGTISIKANPDFSGATRQQFATVTVGTDLKPFALIEIWESRDFGVGHYMEWGTFELVSGQSKGLTLSDTLQVQFKNHVGLTSLRPGHTNRLQLALTQDVPVVDEVALLEESGIRGGALGPPALSIDYDIRKLGSCQVILHVDLKSEGIPLKDLGYELVMNSGLVSLDAASGSLVEIRGAFSFEVPLVLVGNGQPEVTIRAGSGNLRGRRIVVNDFPSGGEC